MVSNIATIGGSLEDLHAFVAVIDFGTVSAAARQLGETKGSISRRVSRLEQRLGTALLARTSRAVSATGEGMVFYAKARDALALLADAAESVRQSQAEPQGHLRVTAPSDFGVDVLPPLIVRFRALHPQISVELQLSDAMLDLAAHRVDLALRASNSLPDTGYRASALADIQVCLYASNTYLATHGTPQTPAAIATHDLVVAHEFGGAASLTLNDKRGRTHTVTTRPILRSNDYTSAHHMILAGGGIGALPDLVAAASIRRGAMQRVLPAWTVASAKLYAISVGGRDAPARVRLFREFVRTELAGVQLG